MLLFLGNAEAIMQVRKVVSWNMVAKTIKMPISNSRNLAQAGCDRFYVLCLKRYQRVTLILKIISTCI